MSSFLRQRIVQTLCLLFLYFALAPLLPEPAHELFYTLSVSIKDLIMLAMPLAVVVFVAAAVNSFDKKAPLFLSLIAVFEGCSNFCSVWYAHLSGSFSSDYLYISKEVMTGLEFPLLWKIPQFFPDWWSSEVALFCGIVLGLISVVLKDGILGALIVRGQLFAQEVLSKVFTPLIPFFILGFVAKMNKTEMMGQLLEGSAALVGWLVFFLALYLALLFAFGARWSFERAMSHIRNLLPAGSVAFSSGSSLSTMPWTIEGTAKNLQNPDLAKAIIPATTNIQQIGDCFANAFLCFLIYDGFYGEAPDLWMWLLFSSAFVAARFATAAVLGGAIFIMLPIYEKYLHFTPEMTAIILAFNVILDPIITSANVLANGALCCLFERVWNRISTLTQKTVAKDYSY
jgi:Na+/H+-dicarboxylate symporter